MTSHLNLTIREEIPSDYGAIRRVNDLAFEQPDEGLMVDALRRNPRFVPELSLVALLDNAVVGHILFFPVRIICVDNDKISLSLAPLAVHPEHQGEGVGGALVREGLEAARAMGYESVMVMGHPGYYPRFGFRPASGWGIRPPIEAPDEAFMALELSPGGLGDAAGVLEYPEEYGL
ncbi:MAG: N-acetyltransferase [Actinomycetota bacterium]|nr:N-acetyltransferase [Actinomycetota bacterium]